jgi:hydrogenase maturation factor
MFKILPIKDKELFLRYAIPCGEVLVRRGELKEELLRQLNDSVKNRQEIDVPIESIFKVATRMCSILARQMGRGEIDDEVIRRYFLLEHEKAIRWRRQIKPDIRLGDCLVYPGKILRIDPDKVMVKTKTGEKLFRNDFAEGLKKRDWVSVHYDYIAEKIKKDQADKMLKRREDG